MGYQDPQFSVAPGRPVLHRVVHALADLGGKTVLDRREHVLTPFPCSVRKRLSSPRPCTYRKALRAGAVKTGRQAPAKPLGLDSFEHGASLRQAGASVHG